MLHFEKKITLSDNRPIIIGIDFEWTKNYKIKNGNIPFCFSCIYFNAFDSFDEIKNLEFGFDSFYVESESEKVELVKKFDKIIKKFISNKNVYFVGHQLHSDLSVAVSSGAKPIANLLKIQQNWKMRKTNNCFDTRYDLTDLKNKSRRLVDVCMEYNLDVKQPELKGSMSLMHKKFLINKDIDIMEKLSVLNLRHSVTSAILYNMFIKNIEHDKTINTNTILSKNITDYAYMTSDMFVKLL